MPKVYDNALVSSYGDSYTYCAEVEDADTWQVDLSKRLGMGIRNFGVGGYGTGQAYLRFHDEFHESPTRIATLGLITENINRIVNVYRPYYFSTYTTALQQTPVSTPGRRIAAARKSSQDCKRIRSSEQHHILTQARQTRLVVQQG